MVYLFLFSLLFLLDPPLLFAEESPAPPSGSIQLAPGQPMMPYWRRYTTVHPDGVISSEGTSEEPPPGAIIQTRETVRADGTRLIEEWAALSPPPAPAQRPSGAEATSVDPRPHGIIRRRESTLEDSSRLIEEWAEYATQPTPEAAPLRQYREKEEGK